MRKKMVKFGRVVSEICEQTERQSDRQTDILITIFRAPASRRRNNQSQQPQTNPRDALCYAYRVLHKDGRNLAEVVRIIVKDDFKI